MSWIWYLPALRDTRQTEDKGVLLHAVCIRMDPYLVKRLTHSDTLQLYGGCDTDPGKDPPPYRARKTTPLSAHSQSNQNLPKCTSHADLSHTV